jgi:hypothetical protein
MHHCPCQSETGHRHRAESLEAAHLSESFQSVPTKEPQENQSAFSQEGNQQAMRWIILLRGCTLASDPRARFKSINPISPFLPRLVAINTNWAKHQGKPYTTPSIHWYETALTSRSTIPIFPVPSLKRSAKPQFPRDYTLNAYRSLDADTSVREGSHPSSVDAIARLETQGRRNP